jgi:hypothetical protein
LRDVKVGDVISFIEIPHFTEDKRMYWIERTITEIEFTKSGKRAYVHFDGNKVKYSSSYGSIGLNSTLSDSDPKFWERMEKERGWRK